MAETDAGTQREAALLQVLRSLADPVSGRDVVAAGLVDSLTVKAGLVHLALLANQDYQVYQV